MERVFFNFQGSAVFGVLAFLAACGGSLVAVVAFVYLWRTRATSARQGVLLVALAGAALYLGTLLAFSLTSREQVLDLHQEKYFCEVDCHLAYSVIAAARMKTLGAPPSQSTAQGVYYVVTVKVRFDETTISSRRAKDLPLTPNPRVVTVIDDERRSYGPSSAGMRALESVEGEQTPLTQPLRPGEFYTTRLVFDLPTEVSDPHLLITEADWVTHLLIGHENSLFHKKTSFRLRPSHPIRDS